MESDIGVKESMRVNVNSCADDVVIVEPGMTYIEGWLEKKTRHLFPVVWKRRYAVVSLCDGRGSFTYFTDDKKNDFKGSVELFSSSKVRIVEKNQKKNLIIINVDESDSIVISLDDEEVRDKWLRALERLLSDMFDHFQGYENLLRESNDHRNAQAESGKKDTLREMLIATSLYRKGLVVGFEGQRRIICLDPSDVNLYDLAISDMVPFCSVRSCPRASDTPIQVLSLHRSLSIPSQVDYLDNEYVVDLRSPESTLRVFFRGPSTAKAWLAYLVELRHAAIERIKKYQLSGLNNLLSMMPNNFHNRESGLNDQIGARTVDDVSIGLPVPPMHIVILVVGTRGDVQPFVNLGLKLQERGHTVRIATHKDYRGIVSNEGLLFYPIGGDPRKLSSYMVKTKGRLIPDLTNSEERHDLPEKMSMMRDITFSCWPACTEPDPEDPARSPFIADAIISNPVTYGHIHCAEALSIPLHIMFPQPWYPTKAFPHPISNVSHALKWSIANRVTYKAFDEFMWAGLKGVINDFRRRVLNLSPLRTGEGGDSLLTTMEVPISHMWSRYLVPPCIDWPSHVHVVGEFTRMKKVCSRVSDENEATPAKLSEFEPDRRLVTFLDACGDSKPVYIGFGSMVIDNALELLDIIKHASVSLGIPMILQNGWTSYGDEYDLISDKILVIGALPHDWLFSQVSGVIHHGGAGTTAAGLRAGNPTFICPFFGDQHFWAEMVHRAGAGPPGCPIADLSVDILKKSLLTLTSQDLRIHVSELSRNMNSEDGVFEGIQSFTNHLPLADMVCEVSLFMGKSDLAKVYCRECGLKMSLTADNVLHREQSGREDHTRIPYRTMNWKVRPGDILEGVSQGIGCALYEITGGMLGLVNRPMEELRYSDNVAVGLTKGLAKGLVGLVSRPIKGLGIMTYKIVESASSSADQSNVFTVEDIVKEKHSILANYFMKNDTLPCVRNEVYDRNAKVFSIEIALHNALNFQKFWKLLDENNDRVATLEDLKGFLTLDEAEAIIAMGGAKLNNSISFAELAYFLINSNSLVC